MNLKIHEIMKILKIVNMFEQMRLRVWESFVFGYGLINASRFEGGGEGGDEGEDEGDDDGDDDGGDPRVGAPVPRLKSRGGLRNAGS